MALRSKNPIISVDGVSIPCPSSYKWTANDISASDAGRTEDTVMDKQRIGNARKLELVWNNVSIEDAATILQAFRPEYVTVVYLDAMEGDFVEAVFYSGDPSGVLYNSELELWEKISFNIVERSGVKDYIT